MEELEKFEYITNLLDRLYISQNVGFDEDGFPVPSFCMSNKDVVNYFSFRLTNGEINKDYNKKMYWGYEENGKIEMDLQNTLKAFNLHPTKFLYLCFFIKDLVETFTVNVCKKYFPFEELKEFSKQLKDATALEVDKFTIKNKPTLLLIKWAVDDLIEKHSSLETLKTVYPSRQTLDNIYRLYLFNKYLSLFLQDKKADKTIQASRDKSLLISRMIYILGLGTHIGKDGKEDYWEEYKDNGDKRNFLKGQLSKYKDVDIQTVNTVYRILVK